MDSNFMYATKDDNTLDNPVKGTGRVSDIIKMSQEISGDWLKKEAEKKAVIQEQIQEQKNKPQVRKPKNESSKKDNYISFC